MAGGAPGQKRLLRSLEAFEKKTQAATPRRDLLATSSSIACRGNRLGGQLSRPSPTAFLQRPSSADSAYRSLKPKISCFDVIRRGFF